MKEIPVKHSNRPAIVDDDDYEIISRYKWHLHGRGYAYTSITDPTKPRRSNGRMGNQGIYMHRLVTNAPKGVQVDHIDCNKLNNTKSNLRFCNNAENHFNAPKRKGVNGADPSSKYKGVTFIGYYKRTGLPRFCAFISVGKKRCLGYFTDEESAARAYDAAAIEANPEFARLNFV